MRRCTWIFALGALFVAAPALWAQEWRDEEVGPARGFVGGSLNYGNPVGPFGELVDNGFGASLHGIYRLDESGWLGLRGDLGFLVYGNERQTVCFSSTVGCRVGLDLTTSNNIAYLGVGPQIGLPTGRVRPYVTGSIGLSYFSTSSSLRGRGDNRDFASDTNFDDLTFAWTGGGGLYIPLRGGARPISIDLSARYHGNGEAKYLRKGDIIDHPDGSISFTPNHSETNLWTFQLGVSMGAGGRR